MRSGLRGNSSSPLTFVLVLRCSAWSVADDAESTRPAQPGRPGELSRGVDRQGRPLDDARAADPAVRVVFKDLWNRPEAFRGRRVIVKGRVNGSFARGRSVIFPPWRKSGLLHRRRSVLPGRSAGRRRRQACPSTITTRGLQTTPQDCQSSAKWFEFTGTFLKMVRYSAGDGDRLAPLVVGDQPPVLVQRCRQGESARIQVPQVVVAVTWAASPEVGCWVWHWQCSWPERLRMAAFAPSVPTARASPAAAKEGDCVIWVLIHHWNSSSARQKLNLRAGDVRDTFVPARLNK